MAQAEQLTVVHILAEHPLLIQHSTSYHNRMYEHSMVCKG